MIYSSLRSKSKSNAKTWMTNRYKGLLLPLVIDIFNLKINRPISSSLKVTVILVTLQRNFAEIDVWVEMSVSIQRTRIRQEKEF